jgi:uncharacterized integral membrane protein (TIGR00698 family)
MTAPVNVLPGDARQRPARTPRVAAPLFAACDAMRAAVPGIAIAAALALAAGWIAGGLGDPLARNPVLVAMLFGLLIGNSFAFPERFRPGLDFTKRYLLRLAVVLVGFRITVRLVADLGVVPLAVAAVELVAVLVVLHWVGCRVLKLDRELSLLIAVGTAVCGAAAILSVAALTRARDQHAGIAIALITLAGTAALLVYPVAFMADWLPGLNDRFYGVFVGASIYELAQVYGASFAVSEGALNTATLVKLSKVLMLVPLLLVLGLLRRRSDVGQKSVPVPFPSFIAVFVGVMLVNSSFTLHPLARTLILEVDQFLFLMVMVALGLTTRLALLRETGGALRVFGAGVIGLLLSTLIAYGLVTRLAATGNVGPLLAESAMLSSPGGRLFASVGCAKCHVPALRGHTGEVTLYSDLLLHNMGPALDDKIIQGNAIGAEWRTTPLIGLGLRRRYLHDGRAATLRDAIQAHGGEAEIVRNRFFNLDEADQQAVLAFLGKL